MGHVLWCLQRVAQLAPHVFAGLLAGIHINNFTNLNNQL